MQEDSPPHRSCLFGQGGDAETGTGHAPVCPTGRKMFSILSLNAGFQSFNQLKKSAVMMPGCRESNCPNRRLQR